MSLLDLYSIFNHFFDFTLLAPIYIWEHLAYMDAQHGGNMGPARMGHKFYNSGPMGHSPIYFDQSKKLNCISSAMNLIKLLTAESQSNIKIYDLIKCKKDIHIKIVSLMTPPSPLPP